MLIIKGKSQKSILANILLDKTKSICFQYYDTPVIFNSICVDNREYCLSDFIKCIAKEFEGAITIDETPYDYLIIYTNEKEEDLKELIDWLNKHRWEVFCNGILVMCKE